MEGRYSPTSNGMWENGLVPLSHLMEGWEGIFCIALLIGENSPSMEYTPMHQKNFGRIVQCTCYIHAFQRSLSQMWASFLEDCNQSNTDQWS